MDENPAYRRQPRLTTPSLSNVRAYSIDEERARGGSRPGIKKAYDEQIGGSALNVQWTGWLDYGFGDSVYYDDEFNYSADGALSSRDGTGWSSATGWLVRDGYTYVTGSSGSTSAASANHTPLAESADDFQDFTMEADVQWRWPSDTTFTFYVGNSTDGAKGTTVTITYDTTYKGFPLSAYHGTLNVAMVSGSNLGGDKTFDFGPFMSATNGSMRVEADEHNVRLFWGNGEDAQQEIARCLRDGTGDTCNTAGFNVTLANPRGGSIPGDFLEARVMNWSLTAITRATETLRELVAIGNQELWREGTGGTFEQIAGTLAATDIITATHCAGKLFIVDGTQPKVYDPVDEDIVNWVARKGIIDKDVRLCALWRNRVILSGTKRDPQNWFMSRQDDPWDFDYGMDDAQSAVAGNQSDAGRIGEPITCIAPLTENMLVFGCTRSIWVMRGDPMAGGWIESRSLETGIVGPNAWCRDADGMMYFMGFEGFYKMAPGGPPQNLSYRRIPDMSGFRPVVDDGADGESFVTLAYDHDRHGVLIFISPWTEGSATHYFYDIRNDAFFPDSYQNAHGPICAAFYDSKVPARRRLVLGSRKGYLTSFDDDRNRDDDLTGGTTGGSAISSYVWLRPQRLGDGIHDAKVISTQGVLSSGSGDVTWGLYGADTVEGVPSATAAASGTWSAGRNNNDRNRLRAGAHSVKLSNDAINVGWAVESTTIEIARGGVQR